MPGIIISVINNKGGCGKTTTVVNLAHWLGKLGKRVLVIDNDSQCNCSDILLHRVSVADSLYHVIKHNSKLPTCIYNTNHYISVYCMPNDREKTAYEEPRLASLLVKGRIEESLFLYRNRMRDYTRNNFDIVLVDNPPNLGLFTTMSLHMADFVIVPNEAGSRFSLEGLMNAVGFIDEVRGHPEISNPDLRFLRLLITKADRRTNASNAIVEHIKSSFPADQMFENIIPTNAAIQQAELMHETVIKFRSNAPGAKAYKKVAEELLAILNSNSGWRYGV
jgi:cellulose biosynthesis protein BcsQ